MAFRDAVSVPFAAERRPEEVLHGTSRLDGRALEAFRTVFLQAGVISQAAGSAYAEFGNTKVMASVFGPRQSERRIAFSEQGTLQCDVKLTSFAGRNRTRFGQSPEERELSAALHTALAGAVRLEAYPKALLDVHCLVLEAGGAELAVATTAAAAALADAGFEMTDLVSACSISRVGGQLLLDPTADEVFREEGHLLLAMMPLANLVTQVLLTGEWSSGQLAAGLELAMGACGQLDQLLRDTLKAGAAAKLQPS